MALIKKIDVENYFAARRAMRLGRKSPARQPDATAIKPTGRVAKNDPGPIETLPLEHSSARAPSTAIPIVTDSGGDRLLRPPGSRRW